MQHLPRRPRGRPDSRLRPSLPRFVSGTPSGRKWHDADETRRAHGVSELPQEDAARAYDAARVKYKGAPTVNFPGEAPSASVLAALPTAPAVAAPPRRSGRAPAPKVIADAPDERAPSHKRQAKRPRETGMHVGKHVEGAKQKSNGKWRSNNFPGREFDDLDAYRAAKKQRAEQRAAYSDQLNAFGGRQ